MFEAPKTEEIKPTASQQISDEAIDEMLMQIQNKMLKRGKQFEKFDEFVSIERESL